MSNPIVCYSLSMFNPHVQPHVQPRLNPLSATARNGRGPRCRRPESFGERRGDDAVATGERQEGQKRQRRQRRQRRLGWLVG